MIGQEIEDLITLLARMPGIGPRSARRMALNLLKRRETLMVPLASALSVAAENIKTCSICGNLDTSAQCSICRDGRRDISTICVVEQIADLWALERTKSYKGQYHILGGNLSALDGIGPNDLSIDSLLYRASSEDVTEVIIGLSATIDGQTTAHYLMDRLSNSNVEVTRLAHGVPVGGELDYLDDSTLTLALRSRASL